MGALLDRIGLRGTGIWDHHWVFPRGSLGLVVRLSMAGARTGRLPLSAALRGKRPVTALSQLASVPG